MFTACLYTYTYLYNLYSTITPYMRLSPFWLKNIIVLESNLMYGIFSQGRCPASLIWSGWGTTFLGCLDGSRCFVLGASLFGCGASSLPSTVVTRSCRSLYLGMDGLWWTAVATPFHHFSVKVLWLRRLWPSQCVFSWAPQYFAFRLDTGCCLLRCPSFSSTSKARSRL